VVFTPCADNVHSRGGNVRILRAIVAYYAARTTRGRLYLRELTALRDQLKAAHSGKTPEPLRQSDGAARLGSEPPRDVSELTRRITTSHRRPHVSDDNPFSESQFKTLKYPSEFLDRFTSFEHGLEFCGKFFSLAEPRASPLGPGPPNRDHGFAKFVRRVQIPAPRIVFPVTGGWHRQEHVQQRPAYVGEIKVTLCYFDFGAMSAHRGWLARE